MGSGTSAAYGDIIEYEDLKKIVPEELYRFTLAGEEADLAFDDFARDAQWNRGEQLIEELVCYDVSEDGAKAVSDAFDSLRDAFYEKTGMTLYVQYRDDDTGDSYDEIDGGVWAVDGTTVESPEVIKMRETYGVEVERKFWTIWG
jgi:hypothetical protein